MFDIQVDLLCRQILCNFFWNFENFDEIGQDRFVIKQTTVQDDHTAEKEITLVPQCLTNDEVKSI